MTGKTAIEIAVDEKLAEWVKREPEFALVSVFTDDHIVCAEFTINNTERVYKAFWIGAERVGAFKYANHCEQAFNDVISIIRDKLMSSPFEEDDYEYHIAIAVGFTHADMLDLGMLDL